VIRLLTEMGGHQRREKEKFRQKPRLSNGHRQTPQKYTSAHRFWPMGKGKTAANATGHRKVHATAKHPTTTIHGLSEASELEERQALKERKKSRLGAENGKIENTNISNFYYQVNNGKNNLFFK
jgi:hypothetical protein